ncbi:MAG TPA: NAD(P)-binding domain-containing protein [Candidatus Aquilonibacter sp.]|nr:NAD(P)-binding domain-containing protein [Candidatus Aquilonibacter sp.]
MIDTAIIGAGPYGLSVAAHFRSRGIPFRIFGRPMDSWLKHMPKGMQLKSDGFASNICDADGALTLKRFCADRGITYSDTAMPVALDTFTSYGLAFRDRFVSDLEEKMVVSIERAADGFRLRLDDGEEFDARRVVLAVGITHFACLPDDLAKLPPQFVSHSSDQHELEPFRGKKVAVIGGGSSALDWAGLLADNGTEVMLVARQTALKFHGKPVVGQVRSTWDRIRRPQSGLGPGLRSRFYATSPLTFHHLPQKLRLDVVRTHLGPSGGWFIKDKVVGRVPCFLGNSIERTEVQGNRVRLYLQGVDGSHRQLDVDHILAGTGYKVNLNRLTFLSDDIRTKVKTVENTPILSTSFESSVPGLHFVGVSAANSFGPVMRFAYGAGFTARHLSKCMASTLSKSRASVQVPGAVTISR